MKTIQIMNYSIKPISLLIIILLYFSSQLHALKKKDIKFVDLYFTNISGERITEIEQGTAQVYLVVNTSNGKGKKVAIRFSEDDLEYIYKKKYYSSLDRFAIRLKSNIQPIPLTQFDKTLEEHQKIKDKALKKKERLNKKKKQ